MEKANLIYQFCVIAISIVMFFIKLTTTNAVFELILKAVGKVVPLYCMMYAGVQIFKHFGII